MTIPLHYKQKSFSCGPAALKMVMQALIHQDIGEEALIKLIGTNEELATPLQLFETNLSHLLQSNKIVASMNYKHYKIQGM